jgi:hypothetical protein
MCEKKLSLVSVALNNAWTVCEIPRDDLFSDNFVLKINTLVSNIALVFILPKT